MNNRRITIISLVLVIAFFSYSWYSNNKKNHSKALKEIGIPMQENVLAFFQKNKKYPNLEESVELINKSGCVNSLQEDFFKKENENKHIYASWASYNCDYGFFKLFYTVSIRDLNVKTATKPYHFNFSKGNTQCSSYFSEEGKVLRNYSCSQTPHSIINLRFAPH